MRFSARERAGRGATEFRESARPIRRLPILAALVVTVLFGLALPCGARGAESPGPLPGEGETWLRLDEMARLFVLRMESAALPAVTSPESEVRRASFLYQSNMATAMLAATSHPDPVLAYLDAWSLARQAADFLETPAGRASLGRHALPLARAARESVAEIREAARLGVPPDRFARAEALVGDWVRTHPIEGSTFIRKSIVARLAKDLEAEPWGTLDLADRIGRTAGALESRLGLLAEVLPRVLRWQSRLAMEQEQLSALVGNTNRSLGELRKVLEGRAQEESRILADLELLVERQRRAALRDAEEVATRLVREATVAAVDEAFRRLAWLLGAAFLGALVLVVVWRRIPPRS